ncbi:MAG TPA: hypothetical protein VGC85_08900, partial [Chthoniobacterales bacterium]
AAHAQQQERKLLDRLLKPDMSLQNDAQGKQFQASGNILTNSVPTKRFWFFHRSAERQFATNKQVTATSYATNSARVAKQQADTSTRTTSTKVDQPYSTTAFVTRDAPGTGKSVATAQDGEAKPFLGRGKSQKSLDTPQRPLTIDEVRELLNKNK